MASLKRAVPFLGRACTQCGRSFHTTPSLSTRVQKSIRRSASKATPKATTPRPGTVVRVRRPIDPEQALPPITLLQSGSKSGALDISAESAMHLLRQYIKLVQQPSPGWEKLLCDDYKTTPLTIYRLGLILNRCTTNAQRSLALRLLHSASLLGENSATFALVESALRKGNLHLEELAGPFKRLGNLAKHGNNSEAMALLGRAMLSIDHKEDAHKWLLKSIQNGTDFPGAGIALVEYGNLLKSRNDKTGAKAAFEKAALESDEAAGYFYLAQMYDEDAPERKVYLLRAASSGIPEASHGLGALEMKRIAVKSKEASYTAKRSDLTLAKEWFEVAAIQGFGLSMLNLALIYETEGKLYEGEKWLKKAEELPEIKNEADKVRRAWRK